MIATSVQEVPIVEFAGTFVTALVVSALLAWPIFQLLLRVGSKQRVSEYVPEHAKKQGTPTMGGLIALAGILVALSLANEVAVRLRFALAGAVIAFALIGFFDDFVLPKRSATSRGFGWIPKLTLQILAAGIVVVFGPEQVPGALTIAWQVFLLLFFVNAYNFADGLDGLSAGLLIFLSGGALIMGLLTGSLTTMTVASALMGAIIPFLWLNAPPAKVFMGDVGSMPIGLLLGFCCIEMLSPANLPVGTVPLVFVALILWSGVLIAELVPVPIQIASVKLFKRRVFPKTPIHHAFESKGIPETRVVWGFLLTQLVLSALAVTWLAAMWPD